MKRFLILTLCCIISISAFAKRPSLKVTSVRVTSNETLINISTTKGDVFSALGIDGAVVSFNGGECRLTKLGGSDKIGQTYKANSEMSFELHFPRLPYGINTISLVVYAQVGDGWQWGTSSSTYTWNTLSVSNNNQRTSGDTNMSEHSAKQWIDNHNNGLYGIYQSTGDPKVKIAFIEYLGKPTLIFLNRIPSSPYWREGDIKASLEATATPGFYSANWYMLDKSKDNNFYISFERGSMTVLASDGTKELYIKMYPTASSSSSSNGASGQGGSSTWTGTGFALDGGYIVTNHHVVDGARTISIYGVGGNFNKSYSALIVGVDKNNDLALIKISDYSFNSFGSIPYAIRDGMAEVGEESFVLGYPLTQVMGNEIKLTNGIISSRSGYQGDISTYQISAPVQPGNSGGPLFDSNGNVVGIVNAGIPGAENVGYAIKTNYLRNLVESVASTTILPTNNKISSLTLPQKVAKVKDYVFFIVCSESAGASISTPSPSSSNSSSSSSLNVTTSGDVKTVYNPSNSKSDDKSIRITKVEMSSTYTKVYLHYDNSIHQSGWVTIEPGTYIEGPGGDKRMLRSATGIPLSPNKHYFSTGSETLDFCLEFPALTYNKSIRYFKLIESKSSSWNFYDIIVN